MIEVDIKAPSDLSLGAFLVLQVIDNIDTDTLLDEKLPISIYTTNKKILNELEDNDYIRVTIDGIIVTDKCNFNKNSKINFDEFWDNFPEKTPNGRSLRTANKKWGDDYTKDFVEAKKKYIAAIKNIDSHNKVIKVLKAKKNNASIEDKNYENGILVYINQRKWQRDVKYLTESNNNINSKDI